MKAADSLISSNPEVSAMLDKKPVCIGLYQQDELQYFASTQCYKSQFNELHKLLGKIGTVKSKSDDNGNEYFHFERGEVEFHYANYSPFLLLSSHGGSIPKSISQISSGESLLSDTTFNKVREKRGKTAMAHIYLQSKQLGSILSPYVSKTFVESIYAQQVFPNGWS